MTATPTSMQVMTLNLPMEFYLIYVPLCLFYWSMMLTFGIGFAQLFIDAIKKQRSGE